LPAPAIRYDVQIAASAARALRKLDHQAQRRISHAIDSLALTPRPHGSQKLTGEDDLYRVRIGDYRIIYAIRDRQLIVLVVAVGHRRDVYRL
jgi:mRNA interferase RelE/StbE